MPDWLFWALYIGIPVLLIAGLGALFVWCVTIVLSHYE